MNILLSILQGFTAHKTSSALGTALLAGAASIPSITGDSVIIPGTLEEAIGQLVLAALGVFAVWYKGKNKGA